MNIINLEKILINWYFGEKWSISCEDEFRDALSIVSNVIKGFQNNWGFLMIQGKK